jgi:hypothetical protein
VFDTFMSPLFLSEVMSFLSFFFCFRYSLLFALINIALQVSKKLNLTTEELSLKLDYDGLRGLVTPHLESVMVSFFFLFL